MNLYFGSFCTRPSTEQSSSSRPRPSGRDESSPCFSRKSKSSKRSSLAEIFDDGSSTSKGVCSPPPSLNPTSHRVVTQVYRAETELDKSEILLGAIIRTSERNEKESGSDSGEPEDTWKKIWKKKEENWLHSQINHGLLPSLGGARSKKAVEVPQRRTRRRLCDEDVVGYEDEVEDEEDEDDEGLIEDGLARAVSPSGGVIPTLSDQEGFQKNFSSATSMVFHGRTGLPLTSSPAPLRKGKSKFEFDSSISSPNDIKRALFRGQSQKDAKEMMASAATSACAGLKPDRPSASKGNVSVSEADNSNGNVFNRKRNISSSQRVLSASAPASVVTSSNLLGSFEESVLNGRLEPVSTVEGFTAEIGASGSFHPKHRVVPVTVFFYTLGGSNAGSSPYLGN